MNIVAIRSVEGNRPTDSGNTIVVELVSGTEELVKVLVPHAMAAEIVRQLAEAGEMAREMRRARGRD